MEADSLGRNTGHVCTGDLLKEIGSNYMPSFIAKVHHDNGGNGRLSGVETSSNDWVKGVFTMDLSHSGEVSNGSFQSFHISEFKLPKSHTVIQHVPQCK